MPSVFEFFVDLDRETLKRIVVRQLDAERYAIDLHVQHDGGWQDQSDHVEVTGKNALARRLIDEGVPEAKVYDDLSMEAPRSRTITTAVFGSLVMWLAIAAALLALVRWLGGLV
jgi:hypothetical protein